MLLELDADVFADDSEQHVRVAYSLVSLTVDGRHDWFPSPQLSSIAMVFLERHFPTLGAMREQVMKAATASAWRTPERPALRVTADSLGAMAEDLSRPAVVVVENGRNDGSFLRAVFAAYSPELKVAVERDWLHIDHAGGTGEQGYLADDMAGRFHAICRVIVVKDNDKRLDEPAASPPWPPDKPWVYMWRRHEVENYLPDAVLHLSDHPEAPNLVQHLREMSPEQQRWIDMKGGWQKGPRELFEDLNDACRRVWRHGFAKHFPRPLVPDTVVLTIDDFRSLGEDVHEELTRLLAAIRQLV